jgi:methyl-accepting chemotaxis protein
MRPDSGNALQRRKPQISAGNSRISRDTTAAKHRPRHLRRRVADGDGSVNRFSLNTKLWLALLITWLGLVGLGG